MLSLTKLSSRALLLGKHRALPHAPHISLRFSPALCSPSCSTIYTLPSSSFSSSAFSPPTPPSLDHDDLDFDISDIPHFGAYTVLLPEEPYQFGVAHIPIRSVPVHIRRPEYAGGTMRDNGQKEQRESTEPRRIQLGGEEEEKLRAAAALARRVRMFSGTLIAVRLHSLCLFNSNPFSSLLPRLY